MMKDGKRTSTLDLFSGSFVLLTGRDGRAWVDAAKKAGAKLPGLQLDAYQIGDEGFVDAYGISLDGATLIRPDGFVASRWRSVSSHADEHLLRELTNILLK
jgi:hypothetical protein